MKQLIYYATLLVLLISFNTSCKDWLDIKPENEVIESEQLSTEEGVQEVINGIYLSLAENSLYARTLTTTLDVLGQLYKIENTGEPHMFLLYSEYDYENETVAANFEATWKQAYYVIANVNNLIEKMALYKDKYGDWFYTMTRAELVGLRAFLHFELLRLFGPMPIAENIDADALPYYTRKTSIPEPISTFKEVLEFISKDLEVAKYGLLDDAIFYKNKARLYRMNYFALNALEARIALYFGDKDKAAEISRGLVGVSGGFAAFVEKTSPWVEEEDATHQENPDRYFVTEALFAIECSQRQHYSEEYFDYNNKDEDFLAPEAETIESLYAGTFDWRLNSWRENPGKNKEIEFVKMQVPEWNSSNKYQIPLMKKSELYLILAEATNDQNEAYAILDELYTNRGYSAGYIKSEINAVGLDQFIQDEYKREFYGEGQYFYCLKRKGVGSIINEGIGASIDMSEDEYVIPLPDSETDFRN